MRDWTSRPRRVSRSLPSYYQHYLRPTPAPRRTPTPSTRTRTWLFDYQQPVYFPGLLFLLVVLTGLAGVLADWRRLGGTALLPWALAVVSIVSPALLTQSLYRYAHRGRPAGLPGRRG